MNTSRLLLSRTIRRGGTGDEWATASNASGGRHRGRVQMSSLPRQRLLHRQSARLRSQRQHRTCAAPAGLRPDLSAVCADASRLSLARLRSPSRLAPASRGPIGQRPDLDLPERRHISTAAAPAWPHRARPRELPLPRHRLGLRVASFFNSNVQPLAPPRPGRRNPDIGRGHHASSARL